SASTRIRISRQILRLPLARQLIHYISRCNTCSQIRRFVMRKLLVGMVALAAAAGGVSACGNSDKTKGKTPAAQTASVPLEKVPQTADVAPAALETAPAPKPRFTLVLGEGKDGFKFRSVMLSDEAKAKIDELFAGDK